MIEGLSHLTFIVKDLEKSTQFWKEVFGAKEIYSSGKKNFSIAPEKFFDVSGVWVAIMQGKSLKEETYNHVAFKVSKKNFLKCEHKIKNLGLKIKEPRKRVGGEGQSIYFYDYDNHLFEIHCGTLNERLKKYKK